MLANTGTFGSRAARFFFMHLGSLVAVIVYFHVYGASGYSEEGLRSALLTALVVKSGYMALAYWYGEHKHFDFGIWIMFAVGLVAVFGNIVPLAGLYRLYSAAILFVTLGLTAAHPARARSRVVHLLLRAAPTPGLAVEDGRVPGGQPRHDSLLGL